MTLTPEAQVRVARNLQRLEAAGAPPEDVTSYLTAEGISREQLMIASREVDRSQPPEPGIGAGIGRGMVDVAQGAEQLARQVPGVPEMPPQRAAQMREDVALYEAGAGPGFDLPRMLGQAAATAPLGGASGVLGKGLAGRSVAGAGTGAAGGAIIYADSPEERLSNTAAGAGGGGVGAAVLDPLARGIGAAAGRVLGPAISSAGKVVRGGAAPGAQDAAEVAQAAAARQGVLISDLSDDVRARLLEDTRRAMNVGDDLTPDDLTRRADIEQAGFVNDTAPTRGQIGRDPRTISDERNISKLPGPGAELQERFHRQRVRAGEILENFGRRVGGAEFRQFGKESVGDTVQATVQAQDKAMSQLVRNAYQHLKNVTDDAPLPTGKFLERVSPVLEDFREILPANVTRIINEIADGSRVLTPSEVIRIDQAISASKPGFGQAEAVGESLRQVQRELLSVLDDAASTAGDDLAPIYRQTKAIAAKRFKALGPKNKLTNQLRNPEANSDIVLDRVMFGDSKDARRLLNFVRPQGDEAINAIRAGVVNKLIDNSVRDGQFLQSQFSANLRKMGKPRLIGIFGADMAGDLERIARAAEYLFYLPGEHTVNTSNTGAFGAMMLQRGTQALLTMLNLAPGGALLRETGSAVSDRVGRRAAVGSALATAPAATGVEAGANVGSAFVAPAGAAGTGSVTRTGPDSSR